MLAGLQADAADPLAPEVRQRLRVLLVERVAPLLLRCLRRWKAGARRPADMPPCPGPRRACRGASRALARLDAPALPGRVSGAAGPGHPEPAAGGGASRRPARRAGAGRRRRLRRADRRAARAGERSLPDATACLCGMLLAKVLCSEELCNCMSGRARVRGMRHLYAVLQWTSQRVAAAVRGCPQRRCAGLGQRWVHLCWPAPHLWPAAAHAVLAFCMMRPCPPPASPAWLGRPGTQHCSPAGGRAAGAPAAAHTAQRAGRTRGGRARRRIAGQLRTGPAAPHVRGARPLPSALDASGAAPAGAAVAVHAPGGHAYHWQGPRRRHAHGAGRAAAGEACVGACRGTVGAAVGSAVTGAAATPARRSAVRSAARAGRRERSARGRCAAPRPAPARPGGRGGRAEARAGGPGQVGPARRRLRTAGALAL